MADHPGRIGRRALLVGAGALAGVTLLEGCGGGGANAARPADRASTTSSSAPGLTLVPYFDGPIFAAGRPFRAPFGIADAQGLLLPKDTPAQVSISVTPAASTGPAAPVTVQRHSNGLQRPYFPLATTLPTAGTYRVTMTLPDGTALEGSLRVEQPDAVTIVQPGARLPVLQLPTSADPLGVTPICTRSPVCALHEVTGAAALAERRPIALLVATPAFCQVSICGPVLEVLLQAVPNHPSVRFLHCEVYADPKTTLDRYAPAMAQLGLQSEPCLFLVGSDGVVAHRLDTIYDADELQAALASLA